MLCSMQVMSVLPLSRGSHPTRVRYPLLPRPLRQHPTIPPFRPSSVRERFASITGPLTPWCKTSGVYWRDPDLVAAPNFSTSAEPTRPIFKRQLSQERPSMDSVTSEINMSCSGQFFPSGRCYVEQEKSQAKIHAPGVHLRNNRTARYTVRSLRLALIPGQT